MPRFARFALSHVYASQFVDYATGASLAVTYALTMPAIKRLRKLGFVQQNAFVSFRDFFDRPQNEQLSFQLQQCEPKEEQPVDHEIPPAYFVFDALRYFDLHDVFAAAGARPVG